MPNPTNETYEEEQQRTSKSKQANQSREANQQQDRDEERSDDLNEDTEELSTADQTDDADLAGREEEIGAEDESIERSANESSVRGGDLDEANNRRDAGAKTSDGRQQADDIELDRGDTRKDDEMDEE